MNVVRHNIALAGTTGDITAATSEVINGRVLSIHLQYSSATGTGFATTAAINVSGQVTSQVVWAETLSTLATTTVNIHRAPRQVAHSSVGVALTATESALRESFFLQEKIVVTCTAVGSGTKSATLVVLTGG